MSHFTEGVLQAYLDDEVAADARAQVGAHVSGCADCAERLQELRGLNQTLSSALGQLDGEPLGAEELDVDSARLDGKILQVGKRRHKRLRVG